jgi:hypothetical protein
VSAKKKKVTNLLQGLKVLKKGRMNEWHWLFGVHKFEVYGCRVCSPSQNFPNFENFPNFGGYLLQAPNVTSHL